MKYIIIFLCASFFNYQTGNAQFFGRLNKIQPPTGTNVTTYGIRAHTVTTALNTPDSIFNAFRPITVAAAYSEPSNLLMAGIGISYQHLDYNYSSELYTAIWSVSLVGFAGGSVVPTTPSSIMSIGIMGGVLSNKLMAGPTYNFGTKQIGVAMAIGISFNN